MRCCLRAVDSGFYYGSWKQISMLLRLLLLALRQFLIVLEAGDVARGQFASDLLEAGLCMPWQVDHCLLDASDCAAWRRA